MAAATVAGPLLSRKRGRLSAADTALLAQRLQALHLPHALSEHLRLARGGSVLPDCRRHLLRLAACEVGARERRRAARLMLTAGLPGRDDDDVAAVAPHLVDGCYIEAGDNVIALGGSGTGKTRLLTALGIAACRRGVAVRYASAAGLADELVAAFEARRLLALHRRLDACRLLIIDDLGAAPLSPAGAALLFEVFSRRTERLSTIVASALPPIAWNRVFGSARLSDAVVDRLAYRLHCIDLGGGAPVPWAAISAAGDPVWREEPLSPTALAGPARRRGVMLAAAGSA